MSPHSQPLPYTIFIIFLVKKYNDNVNNNNNDKENMMILSILILMPSFWCLKCILSLYSEV